MVSTRSSTRQTHSGAKATESTTSSKPADVPSSASNGSKNIKTRKPNSATGPTASSESKKRKPVVSQSSGTAKRAKAGETKEKGGKEKETTTTMATAPLKKGRGKGRPAGTGAGAKKAAPLKRQVTLEEVALDYRGYEGGKKQDEKQDENTKMEDVGEKKKEEYVRQEGGKQEEEAPKQNGHANRNKEEEEVKDKEKEEIKDANNHFGEEIKQQESGIEVTAEQKEKDSKSTILEKGLIYFFFRPRVQIENPSSFKDVQRSFIVLLPLPQGTTLNEAPVKGDGRYRLVAIPKKKLPGTGKHERFLTFVEKPNATLQELKDTFLKSHSYETKTMGPRTTPAPRPIGEGVYAITQRENDRQSHLAYILTIPNEPNELQKEFGLQGRGSFVISARNPGTPAPPQLSNPNPAKYSKEIMDEFNGLRWMAAHPKHLEYENAEILFIGEKGDTIAGIEQDALDALEKLEDEDEARVKALKGSDTIFQDLELSKKQVPELKGTWD